ncbi:hypothetical protein PICSAR120_04296 [Mycobacterium avium subsp. paratuberculosis]|nr:hypothetical protein PICSAR120_04296 [Mycobacterium avium subsp. paratuberculosis]CAG6934275.1 hypothetical protein PICSAR107_04319 [Mycobacterium avium subsp. paratuberculosis]CAG6938104.1 hypothetical protein PICSAR10_04467 [Mycobacterium avium subsp. paratuberculosis]CAG6982535.1 hypothetical protein PICSAR164_01849 [Mycobacterium avium subsp. paratuberculosis]CAG6987572.1 hypothetical protein PICSAR14_02622 [Mycobacterium avium subsp. paratuberculosis]
MSDGVSPPPPACTCAQMPVSASNHNRLNRFSCSSVSTERAQVQLACNCGPASVSMVPALSSTVCPNGSGIAAAAALTDGLSGLRRQCSSDRSAAAPPSRPR